MGLFSKARLRSAFFYFYPKLHKITVHKFFTKTLFLGKNLISLTQCHSTNEEMIKRIKKGELCSGDVVMTDYQEKGRGQRGNSWISDPGKNLLFSVYLDPQFLIMSRQHYITLLTGLGLAQMFRDDFGLEAVVKWPNDIYVEGAKICGILTECSISGTQIESAVVGIGLNVNQTEFGNLNATSMLLGSGSIYSRMEVLEKSLLKIERWYFELKAGNYAGIRREYEERMMWKGEVRTYRSEGIEFPGKIRGVDSHGKLVVETNEGTREFGLKEIEFVR